MNFIMADDRKKKNDTGEIDESTQSEIIGGHDYDGIKELDNEMPAWWRYLFYASIVFAVGYLMRYHIFKSAPLQDEEYLAQFEVVEENPGVNINPEVSKELFPLTTGSDLDEGKNIFKLNCAVCHKEDGGGLVGPNLTDKYWLHGGNYTDIVKVVQNGVPVKGMIAWKNQLSQQKIEQVSSYVWQLYGTNPPGSKKAEGELFERIKQETE